MACTRKKNDKTYSARGTAGGGNFSYVTWTRFIVVRSYLHEWRVRLLCCVSRVREFYHKGS